MRVRLLLTVCAVACALTLGVGSASASFSGKLDVGLKGMFQLGGEIESEYGGQDIDDDLEATIGFGLFGGYEIWKYIDIGFQFSVLFWNTEAGDDNNADRSSILDFSPYVKAKYPMLRDRLEVYVLFPIGLTLAIPSDELEDTVGYGDMDTGVGMNTGLQFGASYKFLRNFSALIEMGWAFHMFDVGLPGGRDLESTMNQFALHLGVMYHF